MATQTEVSPMPSLGLPVRNDLKDTMADDPTNDRTNEPTNELLDPPEAPTVETTAEAPTVEATASQPPATATPAGGPARRSGVFVPTWAFVALAGIVLFGLGLGAGSLISLRDDHHERGEFSSNERGMRSARGPRGTGHFGPFAGPNPGSNSGPSTGNRRGPASPGNPSAGTAFLGISAKDSSDPQGAALVRVVPSAPAAGAGLQTGDVITAIDGSAVNDAATLTTKVRAHRPGDELSVTYTRDGASKTVKVTLPSRGQVSQ